MDVVEKTLSFAGKLLLFIALSIIFIPSYLVVNYLQKPWADMLAELFKL